jgi:hypothetical protein
MTTGVEMKTVAGQIKGIYEKVNSGDNLSDWEIALGMFHFEAMAALLSQSGPTFKLAWQEATRVFYKLQDFQTERNRRICRTGG